MILIPKYSNMVELSGSLSIIVTDTITDKVRQELYVPNLVVTTGKIFIATRMVGTTAAVMSHMGIGTSATAEAVGDSTLGAELTVGGGYTSYARAALTVATNVPVATATNIVTYSASFAAGNPSAPAAPTGAVLREAGIFNASTAGTMLCRTTFPIVTKLPADALTITWTITIQ